MCQESRPHWAEVFFAYPVRQGGGGATLGACVSLAPCLSAREGWIAVKTFF